MPIRSSDQAIFQPKPVLPQDLEQRYNSEGIGLDEPGFIDAAAAAFVEDNAVGNAAMHIADRTTATFDFFREDQDTEFNAIQRAADLGYTSEDELENFMDVYNENSFNRTVKAIEESRKRKQTINDAGTSGIVASMAAAILDLPTLLAIPIGGALIRGSTTALGSAGRVAGLGAAEIAAQETSLQATARERSAEESALNIMVGAAFAGAVGAIGAKLTKVQEDKIINDIKDYMQDPQIAGDLSLSGQAQSGHRNLSAAVAEKLPPEDFNFAGNKVFQWTERATRKLAPAARLVHSKVPGVAQITEKLVDVSLVSKKNVDDIASAQSVETALIPYQGELANVFETSRKNFIEYKKSEGVGFFGRITESLPKTPVKGMTRLEFNERVSSAVRNGGIDEGGNVFVEKSAKQFQKMFEDMRIRLQNEGLLPDDILEDQAASYLSRYYNRDAVIQREPEFRARITPWAQARVDDAIEELKVAARGKGDEAKEASRLLDVYEDPLARQDYIDSILDDVTDSIKGFDHLTETFTPKAGKRGPLKGRTLHVPDSLIEDFLENDVETVAERYVRTVAPTLELQKRFGTANFNEVSVDLRKDFNDSIRDLPEGTARKKATDDFNNSIEDLKAMWEILRGTYRSSTGSPDSVVRRSLVALRTLNYIRLLGGVAISSIPDIGNQIAKNRIAPLLKDAVVPMLRNIGNNKVIRQEARRFGQATEAVLASRTMSLMQIGDPLAKGTGFERLIDGFGRQFGNVSGINFWNNALKEISLMATQSRLIDDFAKLAKGKLPKKEKEFIRFLGIDDTDAKLIMDQMDKHKRTVDGVIVSNVDQWDNARAKEKYINAVNKQVNRTVVVKGVGDTPIFANTEAGKTLLQFLNFAMAANQRVLLAGLQQADAAAATGFVSMISLGMAVEVLKRLEKGEKLPSDPTELIIEGADRSGVLTVPFYFNNIADTAGFGIRSMTGTNQYRANPRMAASKLAGPSLDTALSALNVAGATAKGVESVVSGKQFKLTESEAKGLVRAIPFYSHPALNAGLNALAEGMASGSKGSVAPR